MKLLSLIFALALALRAEAQTTSVETLVCIRHGEKPKNSMGQLSCRGLNRALALPDVLLSKFGTPQYIFAPSPNERVDGNPGFYYIRPLATIEPTAIRCDLPVNTSFGFKHIQDLETELAKPEYQNATIFIAWEHHLLDDFAKNIVKSAGGNPAKVPDWPAADFDTIFLTKITRSNGQQSVAFTLDHEGLNNLSDNCPGPAK